jgi:hypothetical protein
MQVLKDYAQTFVWYVTVVATVAPVSCAGDLEAVSRKIVNCVVSDTFASVACMHGDSRHA